MGEGLEAYRMTAEFRRFLEIVGDVPKAMAAWEIARSRTITKEQVEEAIDAMTPGLIAGPIGAQDSYAWIKYAALAAAKAFGLTIDD